MTGRHTALVTTRPFRAPHHPISDVGLIGGGQIPMPGEGSLAHYHIMVLVDGVPAIVQATPRSLLSPIRCLFNPPR